MHNDVPVARRRKAPAWVVFATVAGLLVAAVSLSGCQLSSRGSGTSLQQAAEVTPPAALGPSIASVTERTQPPLSETASSQPVPIGHVTPPPDLAALQDLALDLINRDRQAAGLAPVVWDSTAAALAQRHAEDMLDGPFFSHWNRDGYGPDHRAALEANLTDAVFENIHAYWLRFDDGRPAPITDWAERVRAAQAGWMQSPGHRDNILDPARTHVGVGIAYRPDIGELRMVQEFVNRYVELAPLPASSIVGDRVTLEGGLLDGASDPLVNLAYEPFLQPLSTTDLDRTSTYRSAAESFQAPSVRMEGDQFWVQLQFDHKGLPGLYHVRVFATVGEQRVLVASPIIAVQ